MDWNWSNGYDARRYEKSHPAWVCGLKQHVLHYCPGNFCHTLRGCVDWNGRVPYQYNCCISHTLRGCVDWNCKCTNKGENIWSHTLRGCVDWNSFYKFCKSFINGHTLRGCVDWNCILAKSAPERKSHTLRGCVDWNLIHLPSGGVIVSHTLRGCVDWNPERRNPSAPPLRSHPAWVCGLKQDMALELAAFPMSHPAWVCGLKLLTRGGHRLRTGHTLRGCVDWNTDQETKETGFYSHTLRGCVDWNILEHGTYIELKSHTLRGCVDWNLIWNTLFAIGALSHPAWVCGLKHGAFNAIVYGGVTPCVGVWIETNPPKA